MRGLGFRARIKGGESSFLVNSLMVSGFSGFTDEVSQIGLLRLGFKLTVRTSHPFSTDDLPFCFLARAGLLTTSIVSYSKP